MIFFPRLYSPNARKYARPVPQDDLRILYDKCIRPALQEFVPEQLSHWPVNYDMAMLQYRDLGGQLHIGSIQLPASLMTDFCHHLRLRLAEHRHFEDSFFCHEWRGLKGSTVHDPVDPQACDQALDHITHALKIEMLNMSNWWIDTAVEVSSPGHVLQWLTNKHLDVLSYMLRSPADHTISNIPQSSRWHEDISAHLYALGGFRTTLPKRLVQTTSVRYVNVYTTDKSPTYQLHKGVFRRHRASEIHPDKIAQLMRDVSSFGELFFNLSGQQGGPVQEGNIRAEGRIQLNAAHDYLRQFPLDLLARCFVAIPAAEWW